MKSMHDLRTVKPGETWDMRSMPDGHRVFGVVKDVTIYDPGLRWHWGCVRFTNGGRVSAYYCEYLQGERQDSPAAVVSEAIRIRVAALIEAAAEVESHWNDRQYVCNQYEQAQRSGRVLREKARVVELAVPSAGGMP